MLLACVCYKRQRLASFHIISGPMWKVAPRTFKSCFVWFYHLSRASLAPNHFWSEEKQSQYIWERTRVQGMPYELAMLGLICLNGIPAPLFDRWPLSPLCEEVHSPLKTGTIFNPARVSIHPPHFRVKHWSGGASWVTGNSTMRQVVPALHGYR